MDNNFNFSHTSNTVSVLGPKFFHFPEKSNSLIKIRNYFETTIPKTFNSKNSSINIPKHEIFPRNIHFSLSLFFSKKRSEKKPRKIFQTPNYFSKYNISPNILDIRSKFSDISSISPGNEPPSLQGAQLTSPRSSRVSTNRGSGHAIPSTAFEISPRGKMEGGECFQWLERVTVSLGAR